MSLLNKASLIQIPSGYKDGTLYSAKPTNGDGDFTFSRGSNLAATRVNSEGLIEKGRENLLLQSNQFDTTWSPSSSTTVTSGQSGYDGSNDAWLLKRSDASARYINQSLSLGQSVYTYSVYAKAESVDWLLIWTYDGSGSRSRYFDLANGVAGATVDGTIDVDIQSVGNGWYRCSITYDDSIIAVRLYPAVDDGTITGGISPAGIYIQDAQLEQGLVATDYIETGASTAQAGILEDMPRLDYSGGASCPSLLLEPQRTNLVTQSEYFGGWSTALAGTGSLPVLTANNAISPEGVQNAYRIVLDSGAGTTTSDFSELYYYHTALTASADYSFSIWLKGENGGEEILMRAVQGTYTKITLTDDWVLYDLTESAAATAYSTSITIRQGIGGIGTINSSATFYAYGAQLELGSYPTSYIPTYGASVTRGADSCTDAGDSSLFDVNGGVLFGEFSALSNDLTFRQFGIVGTTGNEVNLSLDSSSNQIGGIVRSAGSYYITSFVVTDTTQTLKAAVKYEGASVKLFINGALVDTNSSAVAPVNLSEFNYAIGTTNANKFYGKMKQTLVFNSALSDDECIQLTTL